VVGLTITHIFGFDTPSALLLAEVVASPSSSPTSSGTSAKTPRVGACTCRSKTQPLRRDEKTWNAYGGRALTELLRFSARARSYYDESLLDRIHARSRPSL
jgi:hypothetical protein